MNKDNKNIKSIITCKDLIIIVCLILAMNSPVIAQEAFYNKLSHAAVELTKQDVVYDPNYYSIDYPNGDIPAGKGVCTDVIIRAYRELGIDLQKEVHEDMAANFRLYPKNWGLDKPDRNIDHRRVPNLRAPLITSSYYKWLQKVSTALSGGIRPHHSYGYACGVFHLPPCSYFFRSFS